MVTAEPRIRVFISHATTDGPEWGDIIFNRLKSSNLDVYYAEDALSYTSTQTQDIKDAILRSQVFILLLTPTSINRNWISYELGVFDGNGQGIFVPVFIGDVSRSEVAAAIPGMSDCFPLNLEDPDEIASEVLEIINKNEAELKAKIDICPEGIKRQLYFNKSFEKRNVGPIMHFTDFLESGYLKYYSRGLYKSNLPEKLQNRFLSERDLIKMLLLDNTYGIIIHGQGGIGKTRLMLELGRHLFFQKQVVIRIYKNFNNLNGFINYINLTRAENYILLFDYVEEHQSFEEITNWIIRNKRKDIKVIGNCRNSYVSEIRCNFEESMKFIDIGIKTLIGINNGYERCYKRNIILSIIDGIEDEEVKARLKDPKAFRTFYQPRPSFAAFIKYMLIKNPQSELKISWDESFTSWLIKRLKLSVVKDTKYRSFFENKKYIFHLFSCFPASTQAVSLLNSKYSNEINILIKDGWLDEENGELKAVHDSVCDSLLVEYLKHFQYSDVSFNEVIMFSKEMKSTSSLMYSLQRIWEDPLWDEIPNVKNRFQKSIANFLFAYLNESLLDEDWFKYKIDNTHLITEVDRIKIFIKHRSILNNNFNLEKSGRSLAFSMEWVHENVFDTRDKETFSIILRDVFCNVWNYQNRFDEVIKGLGGGHIISSYINLYGIDNYICERFNDYLKCVEFETTELKPISLAIVSWLKNNGEITYQLQNTVKQWYEYYEKTQPEDINETYLMDTLLKATEDITIFFSYAKYIKRDVRYLFNNINFAILNSDQISEELISTIRIVFDHFDTMDNNSITPSVILTNWFNKGYDFKFIEVDIFHWLDRFENHSDVGPIVSRILASGYDCRKVKKNIVPWLNVHCQEKPAGFLMFNWLIYGDDNRILNEFIEPYFEVEENQIFDNSRLLLSNWLEITNHPLLVKKAIKPWLKINGSQFEDSIQICSFWLEKGNDKKLVEDYIKNDLIIHIENIYVYWAVCACVKCDVHINILYPIIEKFLEYHWQHEFAIRLIKKCIRLNLFTTSIRISIFKIINNCNTNPFLGYIDITKRGIVPQKEEKWKELARKISKDLINGVSIKEIEKRIVYLIQTYSNKINPFYFLPTWLRYGGDLVLIENFLTNWLYKNLKNGSQSQLVIINLLQYEKGSRLARDIAIKWLQMHGDTEQAKNLLSSWLSFLGHDDAKEIETWIFHWAERHSEIDKESWRDVTLYNYVQLHKNSL